MSLSVPFDAFAPATIAPGSFLPIDLHVDADRLFSTAVMEALEEGSADDLAEDEPVVLRLRSADTVGVFGVQLEEIQLKHRTNTAPAIKSPIGR